MFPKSKVVFIDQLLWRGSALPPSDEGGAPKGAEGEKQVAKT